VSLPVSFEGVTCVVLVIILLADLAIVVKRPHVPSTRESSLWVAFYVTLALIFAGILLVVYDGATAGAFVAGWVTEYSLSVDNLFVFVLIMSKFAVPANFQQRVLMVGIIVSLILRTGFILLGAAVIERFSWVFFIFGGFLIYTAVQLIVDHAKTDDEFEENLLIRTARRLLPIAAEYDGGKLTTRVDSRKMLTPMVVVFIAIGTTDLLFALDSIPAIFGLTQNAFIVFTATVFALMGLRQLYFLLGGLLDRLSLLSYGLAVILAFIGLKLIFEALHENHLPFINGGEPVEWAPVIPIWASLAFIAITLIVTTVASLMLNRRSEAKNAPSEPQSRWTLG
jgi:tellurite resistance protein TerC